MFATASWEFDFVLFWVGICVLAVAMHWLQAALGIQPKPKNPDYEKGMIAGGIASNLYRHADTWLKLFR